MCSCGHRESQHTASGSQSCLTEITGLKRVTCLCSGFDLDVPKPGYFQPANHVSHTDTCRNCGKSESFHQGGKCRKKREVKDPRKEALKLLNRANALLSTVSNDRTRLCEAMAELESDINYCARLEAEQKKIPRLKGFTL